MLKHLTIILLFIIAITSCNSAPDYVISESDMVDLMVDIHKAEGIIELNQGQYKSDSLKRILKQAVFDKHNVDQAKFDTSLVWYGKHIEDYIDIYTKVIDRLTDEQDELKKLAVSSKTNKVISNEGDSVNIWNDSQSIQMNNRFISNNYAFDIPIDMNFHNGDKFEWNMLLHSVQQPLTAFLGVEYYNGSYSYKSQSISNRGYVNIKIQSDSTLKVKRIYGFIHNPNKSINSVYIDSISLIRQHINSNYNIDNQKNVRYK